MSLMKKVVGSCSLLAVVFVAVMALVLLLSGCGSSQSDGSKVQIVASTPQVADIARQVGGGQVEVTQILPNGTDPHGFQPKPSDVKALTDADLIVRSGGEVDSWIDELVESSGSDAKQLTLLDVVGVQLPADKHEHEHDEHAEENGEHEAEGEEEHEDEEEHGHEDADLDPHWWQNQQNVIDAVAALTGKLSEQSAVDSRELEASAKRYTEMLNQLDSKAEACFKQLPSGQRKVVTTHHSLGYLVDRYNLEVAGALIESLSSEAEPSVKSINELVEAVQAEGVKAVFPEQAVNQQLADALAKEAGITVAEPLWVDTLSPDSGDRATTYIGAYSENVENLINGLSGGKVTCTLELEEK